jgi:tetratricopeptide (TPR) repeat protein
LIDPTPNHRRRPRRPKPRSCGTRTISSIRSAPRRSAPRPELRSAVALLAFVVAFVSLRAAPARAQSAPSQARVDEASKLYDAGSRRYALGDYAEAIELFRKAYELTDAPELLFDIAQAYRLAGNCPRALETYRHFVRLAPASSHRQDAAARIEELAPRCGAGVAAPPPAPVERAAPVSAPPPTPEARSSTRSRVTWILIGTSVASGLVAGGLYLWNDGRHETWSAEDGRLAEALGTGETIETRYARQTANDELLRSIQRVDAFTVGFLALAGGAAIGAAAVALWPTSSAGVPTVALHPQGAQLAWTVRFP